MQRLTVGKHRNDGSIHDLGAASGSTAGEKLMLGDSIKRLSRRPRRCALLRTETKFAALLRQ